MDVESSCYVLGGVFFEIDNGVMMMVVIDGWCFVWVEVVVESEGDVC